MADKIDIARHRSELSETKRVLLEKILRQATGKGAAGQVIQRREQEAPAPVSFAQQRLWFLNQLEPDNPFYNIPRKFILNGSLDVEALERSLNEILRRHEVLRTTFDMVKGELVQLIAPPRQQSLPVIDLSQWPEAERKAEIERLAVEEAKRVFDLTQAPLLRASLVRSAEHEHVLLLTMHHIVSDGWSMGVLFRELAALYEAFSAGKPSPLPALSIQYADYAVWQREWLQGAILDEQLEYWKRQLAGAPAMLEMPTDMARPVVQSFRGAKQPLIFDKTLVDALKSLSAQRNVTLFMVLLTAFKILLYRYSGQADISVGTPVANRNRVETEGLIGFFVNTLVLRTDMSGDPSFGEVLRRVKEVCLGGYAHQDVPFDKVVEELQPERSLSYTPLFQVMFALQNASTETLQLQGLEVRPEAVESGTAIFDLTLYIEQHAEELYLVLQYNSDLFERNTITRLLGHYRHILEAVVADPQQRIADIPLLSKVERQQLLIEWNQTQQKYAEEQCPHELFEEQAERTPEAVAVIYDEQRLTYQELNQRANQLSSHLRKMGVGPESLVGICMERSLEMVVGLLGVLKAGGAYVPLDPTYPKERLAFMLEDARVRVLLTKERLLDALPDRDAHTLCLDTDWEKIAQESATNQISGVTADNLAYVIYTSGSTGKPKGVAMCHRSLSNLLSWQRRNSALTGGARTLQFASLNFDVSFQEIFSTWCSGGTLVLVSEHIRRDTVKLLSFLTDEAIERLFLPYVALQQLAETAAAQEAVPITLSEVITAGEQLQITPHIKGLFEKLNGCPLYNQYGPSESHVVTAYRLSGTPSAWPELPSIGRPIANTEIYILDSGMQPVSVGVAGELHIGGDSLARSYLGRPELTAEKFIPNPFGRAGARLYKSGDLARFLPDGNIEFLGRIDHQVKIRGFRIELGEVEAALAQHPALREVVVITGEDTQSNKQLVAYVVANSEQAPTVSKLRSHLATKLPEYMIPSAFIFLDKLPLTPSGKIDRRALPTLTQARLELEESFVVPRTPAEEVLAGIWAEVLNVEQVGVNDNFFELGGHSLLATKVISRVREAFGVGMPVGSLFQAPTVAGFAKKIEAEERAERHLQAPPLVKACRENALPLSYAQQRLWFLDQLEPGNAIYNLSTAVSLLGDLNIPALEQSFNEIIRRHESLRTTFVTIEGQPVQVIAPVQILSLSVETLEVPEDGRVAEVRRLANSESRLPFDLSQGPLLRARLLQIAEDHHVLLLTMHHIVSDGWSMEVFFRELGALYEAFRAGQPSPLPELPIQYADYSVWQREWLQGEIVEEQLRYWREQMRGASDVLELPTDRPRPAVQSFRGARQSFMLPKASMKALEELSRREGVTLYMTLLAAFKTLLYRYTGQKDITIGSPVANRDRAEIEGLIGFFVNTLMLRTRLSPEGSFRELLKQVREIALGAYAHQDLPFEKLVEDLQPERALSHQALFQVMFSVQNATPQQALQLSGLQLSALEIESVFSKFDLTLYMMESKDELGGIIEYNTDIFDASKITRLWQHFGMLLEGIIDNPDQRLSELPLLTRDERQQLLVEWNDTRAEYPQGKCIHELFEAQVERTPDAVAVAYEGEQLTYRELNERANQLARYLQSLGVSADTLVGIMIERSIDMMVGILGILKAGGAYVPLDPDYPRERLSFTVEDAQVTLLLTQQRLAEKFLGQLDTRIVSIDKDREKFAQESNENPQSTVGADNLAYVIYTSGSTGRPKGVMISHSALSNHTLWMQSALPLTESDRVLQKTSLSFDASMWELFAPLCAGACLVLARQDGQRDTTYLVRTVAEQQITILQLVPSMLQVFLDEPLLDSCQSLRRMFCGGEPVPIELQDRFFASMNAELHNLYGPTEAAIDATHWQCVRASERRVVPIGRPVAGDEVYILDALLQPVPVGAAGELHIGGAGLGRGYHRRQDLTAERFIPHPFSHAPGERLYKTGDLARYLPDGAIEFLGRLDTQVKLRGFRIELGEVEAALRRYAWVRDGVVLMREDAPGDKHLVAYIVWSQAISAAADEEEYASISKLRRYLREQLPEYMVPTAYVVLTELPLMPNGKLDRKALPAPERTQAEIKNDYVAPRTAAEEQLAAIWQEVLRGRRVSVQDNFFDLGGHSLLATQIISLVRKDLGVEIPLRRVFEAPTIAELAVDIEKAKSEGTSDAARPIMPISRRGRRVNPPAANH